MKPVRFLALGSLLLLFLGVGLQTHPGYSQGEAAQSYQITSIPIHPQGTPAGLAVDSTSNRVYVANFAGGEVHALDGNTLTTLWTKPVGSRPVGVAVDATNGTVFLANSGDNTVSVLRGTDGVELARIPVRGFPNGIAINSATQKVYVSNRDSDDVTVIDATTNSVLISSVPVGQEPMGVAVNPSTNRIYVPNRRDNSVTVLNGSTDSPMGIISLAAEPGGAAVDPGLNKIYVGSSKERAIFVINGATNSVVTTVSTWRWPESVAVDANTHRVYASILAAGWVAAIDGNTNAFLGYFNTTTRGLPLGIAVNSGTGTVYTAMVDQGVITAFDLGGSIVAQASLPLSGGGSIALDPQTSRIYLSRMGDDSVTVIDETTDSIVGLPIPVGLDPNSIVVNPASQKVYVSNRDKTVSVISEVTNSVIATVGLPSEPAQIDVDATANRIYLTLGAGIGSSGLAIIDGQTDTLAGSFLYPLVPPCPLGIAVDPAVNHLYVTDVCEDRLYVFDLAHLPTVLTTVPVGKYPLFMDVDPSTHRVYVANSDDDTVTVIDGASSAPLSTLSLPGARPLGVAVNETAGIIYVSNGGGLYRGAGLYSIDEATYAISHADFGGNGALAVDSNLNRLYVADGVTATLFDLQGSPATSTPSGTHVEVLLGNDVTAAFASVATSGDTSLIASDSAPTTPSGFTVGSPPRYYDISSTATISCPCTVTLPYDAAQTPDPRIYHLEQGLWVDVTTADDPANSRVTGVVSSLSFFTVGQPLAPPAVGGIVELQRDPFVLAAHQFDWATPPYTAVVGAAAAGAILVALGGWYARRRWLR